MICIYDADCKDFSNNGIGTLLPQSCSVSETLNGEYEVTLVHPLDAQGRWKRLSEGRILRVPVPAAMTPQMKLVQLSAGAQIYRVSTSGSKKVSLRSGSGTSYKNLKKYRNNSKVILLRKTDDDWYEVTASDGKRGYMEAKYLAYVRTDPTTDGATNEVVEQTQQRDQPFRIYRVVPDLEKVTVYARHVFYDLMENMVRKYEPVTADTGAKVVLELADKCLSGHDFTFYSDLESTSDSFSLENTNPVDAILGDDGVVDTYGGELARDWFDVYLVQRVGNDTDVQIREGKNLTGVSYDLDISNVTTRIMPTGEDKNGELLYLPEVYIDSPRINEYPSPKWLHMAVSDAKEVTSGDKKKSKSQCYAEMRKAAQTEFDEGCDLPTITLKVDFLNCADTEEYRQYKALSNIYLGDAVRVIARRIGVEVSMRMTQYTYDCLTRKYTSVTLGTIAESIEGNVITSRQISNGSISGAKLVNGAVGSSKIAVDAVQTKHLAAGAITAEKLAAGSITADKIKTGELDAITLEAVTAKIDSLTAKDIETDKLAAALAAFTVVTAGSADFDRATVAHLVAQALNLEYGTAGTVYIKNLAVQYAQMVGAAIGNLCIKASDGNYYAIDVNQNGNVTATRSTVSVGEITAGQTDSGRVILETNITAANLSAGNLLATYALVNRIDAARLDVDELFAREAFISALTTSKIFGGKSLEIIAGETDNASRVFRQEEFPDSDTFVKPGDLLVQPSTGLQYQAVAAGSVTFALDENGNLYCDYDGEGSLSVDGFSLYAEGFDLSVTEDGRVGEPYSWALVQDGELKEAADTAQSTADMAGNYANEALDKANAAVSQVDFQRVVRIDDEGLHVGDNLTNQEVVLGSGHMNVVIDGVKVATYADKFIRLGNMQVRNVRGGLAISVYKS